MNTRNELVSVCLTHAESYQDFPFKTNLNYCAIRHRKNKKIFALIFEREGHIWVNLKTDPMLGGFLRESYPAVVPAFHMNKEHWISVILDGSLADAELLSFIKNSYDLTKPK